MKRLVLIACHRDPFVVANRLRLLRQLGGHDVRLLYGGRESLFGHFTRVVRALTGTGVGAYCIRGRTPLWKWAQTDLAVLQWFRDEGSALAFDQVIVLQWDIVLCDRVDEIYAGVPADGVGLTGLIRLAHVENTWPWLTDNEPYREEWARLAEWARREYGVGDEPHVCIGPGYCLSRAFLEAYSAIDVPDLCHDELRLPLMAQALGFPLYDTGLYRSWTDPQEQLIFNADRAAIRPEVMQSELERPGGRRVFHPVRSVVATRRTQDDRGVVRVRFDRRDRVMVVGSRVLTTVMGPPRRIRTMWVRFSRKVLRRRTWPMAPRSASVSSWHE